MLRMSWSDVLNVFDGIYLSWDPARWSQALTFHGWVPHSTSHCVVVIIFPLAGCGDGADMMKNVSS